MKNNKIIKKKIFGVERELEIVLVGDDAPDLMPDGNYAVRKLNSAEEKLVKWIEALDFDQYKDKITKYINYELAAMGDRKISSRSLVKDHIYKPQAILVNVREDMDEDTADVALFAESEEVDDGVLIAFKNEKYFGMSGFDDSLSYFEDFENPENWEE